MKSTNIKLLTLTSLCACSLVLAGCSGDNKTSQSPEQSQSIPIKPHQKRANQTSGQKSSIYKDNSQSGSSGKNHSQSTPRPQHQGQSSNPMGYGQNQGNTESNNGSSNGQQQNSKGPSLNPQSMKGTATMPHNTPINS